MKKFAEQPEPVIRAKREFDRECVSAHAQHQHDLVDKAVKALAEGRAR